MRKFKARKRNGFRVSDEDVQKIHAFVDKHNGAVTPELFVKEQEPEDTDLHHLLEWDNARAGAIHRLRQAAYYLKSYELVEIMPDGAEGDAYRGTVAIPISIVYEIPDAPSDKMSEPHVYMSAQRVLKEQPLLDYYVRRLHGTLMSIRREYAIWRDALCATSDGYQLVFEGLDRLAEETEQGDNAGPEPTDASEADEDDSDETQPNI